VSNGPHDLARELRAVGFNLDRGAQAIGVSRDWVVVAQNRVAWRSLVAAGSSSSPRAGASGSGVTGRRGSPMRTMIRRHRRSLRVAARSSKSKYEYQCYPSYRLSDVSVACFWPKRYTTSQRPARRALAPHICHKPGDSRTLRLVLFIIKVINSAGAGSDPSPVHGGRVKALCAI